MIALQMLVGLVFIFMGVTRLADKFVHAVPNSVKGGILLAAPVTVMAGQLGENGNMHKYKEKEKTISFLIWLRDTEIFSHILSQW